MADSSVNVATQRLYTAYVVYLVVALIWQFGELRKYRQIKCTLFRRKAWVSFHIALKTVN